MIRSQQSRSEIVHLESFTNRATHASPSKKTNATAQDVSIDSNRGSGKPRIDWVYIIHAKISPCPGIRHAMFTAARPGKTAPILSLRSFT